MKYFLVIIALLFSTVAEAQSNRNPCIYGVGTNPSATLTNGNCLAVGYYLAGVSGAPMPVGGIANASAPTFTEGKPGYLSFDLNGNLRVTGGGGGGGGLSVQDNTAFTYGTSNFTPTGGFYNSTIVPITSGNQGAFALTANRDLHIDAVSGTNLATLINNPPNLNVNGTPTAWTGLTPGTAQTGTKIVANTDLSSVGGAAYALGQQLAALSAPVVLTAAQITALTPPTTVTANQGTANTATNGWPTKITDGTNTTAVKAANTAPTTSDPGVVANINCSYTGGPCITLGPAAVANSVPFTFSSQYPTNATTTAPAPLAATSGNVAAATATATLSAASGKTTYITGFQIAGSGATIGTVVNCTVTNIVGSITLNYPYAAIAGALLMNTPIIVNFNPAVPANAANTSIVVSCPSLGTGNTNNTVNAFGYQL